MSHLRGEQIECPGGWPEITRRWPCIDPDSPRPNCSVGGQMCDDGRDRDDQGEQFGIVEGNARVSSLGQRWLEPDPQGTNRDAYGLLHDLRSNELQFNEFTLVPARVHYHVAPTWTNDGLECYEGDLCDAWPSNCVPGISCTPGRPCEPGAILSDCVFYQGTQIRQGDFRCREVTEHGPLPVMLTAGLLLQGPFARSGVGTCVSNWLVPCMQGGQRYFQNPCRDIFNYCSLRYDPNDPVRIIDESFDPRDRAATDAKNAILRLATDRETVFPGGTGTRFDLLDDTESFTGDVGSWRRAYGPADIPCGDMVEVAEVDLSGSYLRQSGCRVDARLVIVRVMIEVHIVAHRVDDSIPGNIGPFHLYAHSRAKITVECGIHATLPDGPCVLTRPWLDEDDPGREPILTLRNRTGGSCADGPIVEPPLDEIVYIDGEGREFDPPRHVVWWGYLGDLNGVPDTYGAGPGDSSNVSICCAVRKSISGTIIPAWPSGVDSQAGGMYGGSISVVFDQLLTGCCDP